MSNKLRLIAFINTCCRYKTGSDLVFIEIAKRIPEYEKIVITPVIGKALCQICGLKDATWLITSHGEEIDNVILNYIKRTLKAFFVPLKIKSGDILLSTSDFFPDVLPVLWFKFKAKLQGKKVSWVQHIFHFIPHDRKISFYAQQVSLFLIKHLADAVTVDNSLLEQGLTSRGFSPDKITINYPGINLEHLRGVRADVGRGYDAVFMAQLRRSKGALDLVKIWDIVCKQNPKLKLGIIGTGELLGDLKKLTKELGLEQNVTFLGYLQDDEAYAVIKASRVFASPSQEEGFGISILEAQALGLPVVSWHLPVFDEIHKQGMVKVEIGNIEKFAQELLKLLEDEEYYNAAVQEALVNSSKYDWSSTAQREREIYSKLQK